MSHFTEGCGGTDIPPVGLAESSFCCWRRRHVIPRFSSVGGSCPPFHVTERGRVNTLNAYYIIGGGVLDLRSMLIYFDNLLCGTMLIQAASLEHLQ
jgi:hypothetical protein